MNKEWKFVFGCVMELEVVSCSHGKMGQDQTPKTCDPRCCKYVNYSLRID